MKKSLLFVIMICMMTLLISCEDKAQIPASDPQSSAASAANPKGCIKAIYEDITIMGLEDADSEQLNAQFDIDSTLYTEFAVRCSNGRFGVSDVFIMKPAEGQADVLREALEKVKLDRTSEFENYDVMNSLSIAQSAQIFEQGGYVIMLMLEDNETARELVDQYIPK